MQTKTWKQEFKQSQGGMLLIGLFSVVCSACFLTLLRTPSPGVVLLTVGWALSHPLLIKKMLHSPVWWRHFLNWGSSSQMTLGCVKLTKITSTDSKHRGVWQFQLQIGAGWKSGWWMGSYLKLQWIKVSLRGWLWRVLVGCRYREERWAVESVKGGKELTWGIQLLNQMMTISSRGRNRLWGEVSSLRAPFSDDGLMSLLVAQLCR